VIFGTVRELAGRMLFDFTSRLDGVRPEINTRMELPAVGSSVFAYGDSGSGEAGE